MCEHVPLLEITLTDSVETVRADRGDCGQDHHPTRTSHRQVTLVLDGLEPALRGHISVIPRMSQNTEYWQQWKVTSTATGQSRGEEPDDTS